ncbi:MAG TPA: hypothetical protein VGB74_21490 [Actinoplanes sp.]|jgi:hypothetical protein
MNGSGPRDFDNERTPEQPPPPGKTTWPRISDYWPDNPRRTGPLRDNPATSRRRKAELGDQTLVYNQIYPTSPDVNNGAVDLEGRDAPAYPGSAAEPAPVRLIGPPPGHRRPRLRLAVTAAGAAVFVGLSGIALARTVTTDDQLASPPLPGDEVAAPATAEDGVAPGQLSPPVSVSPSAAASASATPSAPSAPTVRPPGPAPAGAGPAFAAGTFVLAANVTELNVTVGRPPTGAIKASSPPDSGLTTRTATAGTTVTLTVQPSGRPGGGRVDVQLDQRIAWTIKMSGGVRRGTFALTGGTVRAVDLSGGADTIDLALPPTSGALPIRMSGGVHTWRIRTGRPEPVLVNVREGAGAVTLYGKNGGGVAKGKQVSAGSGTGLQIEAVAGIGTLTVSAP